MNQYKKIYYNVAILSGIGSSLFIPIFYLFLENKPFSYTQIGWYLSVFYLISFLSEVPCGAITDSIGAKKSLLLSYLLRLMGLILLLSHSLVLIIISALFSAIAESFGSGTMSSWLVNMNNKNGEQLNIEKVFARSATYGSVASMVVGFMSVQYLFTYNHNLPIIISCVMYSLLFCYILVVMPDLRDDMIFSFNTLKQSVSVVKQSLRDVFLVKTSIILLVIFTLPAIIDLGPSNQWQAVFEKINYQMIAYLWLGMGITNILGSLLFEKYFERYASQLNVLFGLLILLMLLLEVVVVVPNVYIKFGTFLCFVFMYQIISIQVSILLHKMLITNDDNRTTMVSVFYSFESIVTTVLLVVNGYLTDHFGILMAWEIFMLFVVVIVPLWLLKKKNI